MKKIIIVSLASVVLALAALTVSGCVSAQKVGEATQAASTAESALDAIAKEVEGLRGDLAEVKTDDPDAQEMIDSLVAQISEKSEDAQKWLAALSEANATVQEGQDGWAWAEALVGLGAGIFPPLALGVPIIQRSRKAFENVVQVVAAGGGPADRDAAQEAMRHYPGLKARVTATRVKIGDKEIQAVRTKKDDAT